MLQSSRGTALASCLALLLLVATNGLAGAAAPDPVAEPQPAKAIDINTAGVTELSTIPGIGETMAQRIVDWRDEHGPFRRVEDLMKVKGIGEKSLEKIRSFVRVAKSD